MKKISQLALSIFNHICTTEKKIMCILQQQELTASFKTDSPKTKAYRLTSVPSSCK